MRSSTGIKIAARRGACFAIAGFLSGATLLLTSQSTGNGDYSCSPAQLNGSITLQLEIDSLDTIERKFWRQLRRNIPHGPSGCNQTQRVAVITPYRNRSQHLLIFLNHIHRILGRQRQQYGIFVVEPLPHETFNRAKLLNIGYVEALKMYPLWDCFLFHDVDVLAENDRNAYRCNAEPRAMAIAFNHSNYKPMYATFVGAAVAVPTDIVRRVNGHSNDFWGWGSEDDDFSKRLKLNGYRIERTPLADGHMSMLYHRHREEIGNLENPCATKLASQTEQRYKTDGLNTLRYTLLNTTERPAYIHFYVDMLEEETKKLEREKLHC